MEEYRRGTAADAEAILDFANYVFSLSDRPHDFKTLLPKLYGEGCDTARYHHLILEDGKIRAMVCVCPTELSVAGKTLKAGCVGTVSVHPYARGRGYMKRLMARAVADMKEEGDSFSLLDGQRQRYEFFGYERTGILFSLTLTEKNVRLGFGGADAESVSFREFGDGSGEWERAAYGLYRGLPVTGARGAEDFAAVCRSWDGRSYAVLDRGRFAGYLTVCGDTVTEIELADPSRLPAVCAALFREFGCKSLQFTLPAYDTEKLRILSRVCEGYEIGCANCYQIFDYAAVIGAFLTLKSSLRPLRDGKMVLGVKGAETVEICVRGGKPSVRRTEERADCTLTPAEAAAGLFSPLGSTSLFSLPCPEGWFPLPLYVPRADVC